MIFDQRMHIHLGAKVDFLWETQYSVLRGTRTKSYYHLWKTIEIVSLN
jgi:hypothetical protein